MTTKRIDSLVWDLEPEKLREALRVLADLERIGWVSPQESSKWRSQIAELGVYQEDQQLWIDEPKA